MLNNTNIQNNNLQRMNQHRMNPNLMNMNRPMNFGRGRLQLDIIEGRLIKNYGFTKMDPYVRVIIQNRIYETPTDPRGSITPVWRKTMMW
jgi:hypothetical protein